MSELLKYYDEYKKINLKKNLEGEKALKSVRQKRHALKYVKNQTEEICLEAVKKDGWALQFVNNQTEKICLEAVKENGQALKYVNENIFLEILKNNKVKVSANGKEVWISKESAEALGLGE